MGDGQIHVLGAVHLGDAGGGRTSVGNDASLRLLASLVAAEGGVVATTDLAERLWSDDAPGTRLRMTVSRLRARLGEVGLGGALVTMGGGYRLDVPVDAVDAAVFTQRVQDARAAADSAPTRAITLLQEGLALWQGTPFDGLDSEPWLAGTVERLRTLRLGAEDLLMDLRLREGEAAAVVDLLERAVEAEPLRERRWVQLVSALAATSRRSDALRAVHRARRVLGDAVGLDLGPELVALEHDLLAGTATSRAAAPWRANPELIGRDAELTHLRRVLRSTRTVVVVGLGGVGKSALATAFAAELEGTGLTVLRTAVDATRSSAEALAQFAATVGIQGTDDPEGLVDAIVRRSPREGLWIVDGAEADPEAVADVVGYLSRALPTLRFLVTSRVPLPLSDASPLPLEPLAIGNSEAPGPAMRVLSNRAGVLLDTASRADREAVARLCHRAAGLPLAIELLAAASAQSGLHALAAHEADHAPGVEDSVRWALDAMPVACRRLLEHAAHLGADLGPRLGATLGGCEETALLSLLGPAVQARLLRAVPVRRGHRYQLPDAVRSAIRSLPRAPELDLEIHAALCGLGRAVGPLHGPADPAALRRLDDELDNVRHWLGRLLGRPEGLELARATARGWKELGLGGEGADWLHQHVASTDHPEADAAAARIEAGLLRGVLDLAADDQPWLEECLAIVDAADDVVSWLHGTVLLTVVCGWTGDISRGYELLVGPVALARLEQVGDPWFRTQRQVLPALGPMSHGLVHESRGYLRLAVDEHLAQGDVSGALEASHLRIVMARVGQEWDLLEQDLDEVDPLLHLGLARGTVAALRAEAAFVLRARGDETAPEVMASALSGLERAGGIRLAAGLRGELADWLHQDGREREALTQLQTALPTLLRYEPRGGAVVLVQLADLVEPAVGAVLVGAARMRRSNPDSAVALPEFLRVRVDEAIDAAERDAPAAVHAAAQLTDAELLGVVAGLGRQ